MRRHLDARPVLVVGEERHLLGRRDMQHVHALAVLLGEPHEPLRAISAASGSRHSGWLGIALPRKLLRSLSRASSSAWNAARRGSAR